MCGRVFRVDMAKNKRKTQKHSNKLIQSSDLELTFFNIYIIDLPSLKQFTGTSENFCQPKRSKNRDEADSTITEDLDVPGEYFANGN